MTPIVSCEWLNQHLDDGHIVVVDCRFDLMQPDWGRSQYELAHLPQAHYLDLNRDLSGPPQRHGGRHPLPDVAQLSCTLGQLGIGPASHVIAYDDSRLSYAARLWWLLRYLGHFQVSVLDGGLAKWQRLGYPVTRAMPLALPAEFTPQIQHNWVVNREQVLHRSPQTWLIDSRESARYRGEVEPIDPIAGHIPGALNLPWQSVLDAAGQVQADQRSRWVALKAELEGELDLEAEGDLDLDLKLIQQSSGSQPPSVAMLEESLENLEYIVYCGSGVTACVNLLSLQLAGLPQGKLYAGSWSDWCSYLVEEAPPTPSSPWKNSAIDYGSRGRRSPDGDIGDLLP
jgi:thiosulfate/3-mercaptopyruvate sulfurtransferase